MIHRLQAKHWALVGVGLLAAAGFGRLAAWQLDRHTDRVARNADTRASQNRPAVTLSAADLGEADPDRLAWRRVRVAGRYDYGREAVLRGRALSATPGVHVLTPLVVREGMAVLVNRGWMPAADGTHAPLSRGRPAGARDSAAGPDPQPPRPAPPDTVSGLALAGAGEEGALPLWAEVDGERRLTLRRVHLPAVEEALPYRLAPFYVRRLDRGGSAADKAAVADTAGLPVALPPPDLGDGPHLEYAFQWLAFAAIALAGPAVWIWSDLRD